jgi:hypothetical protein
MNSCVAGQCWYHGSPLKLRQLRAGSSVTRNRRLAIAFPHSPTLVSVWDDGRIKHNGTQLGYLYCISLPLDRDDLTPHPRSTMSAGQEFLTTRALPLTLLCVILPAPEEALSQDELMILRSRMDRGGP